MDGAPKRIVVVGASGAQTVWELGAQDRVVGISSYTSYLDNASAKPTVVDSYGYAKVEDVLARSPDLVLLANIQKDKTAQRLREAGVTVYKFHEASSIDDIEAKTRLTGHLVGNCDEADDTVDLMEDHMDTVREVRERADDTPTMYYPQTGGFTSGPGSFITDVMSLAGAHNIALDGDFTTSYPQPSEEFVVNQDPDWLLATYTASTKSKDAKDLLPQTKVVSHTRAYQNGNVVKVNANHVSQPAPRVVYAIENITRAIHPDAWAAVTGSAVPSGGSLDDSDHDYSVGVTTTTTETPPQSESGATANATVSFARANASVTASIRNASGNVSVDFANASAANASVTNASANASVTNISANATAVTGANVSLANGTRAGNLTLTVSDPTTAVPNGTDPLDVANASASRYFVLNATGVSDANVSEATIRFRVAPDDLPNGTDSANVTLYRHHNGTWNALPTTHLNGSAYAATTSGFSTYAIGAANATTVANESASGNETTSTVTTTASASTATTTTTTTTNASPSASTTSTANASSTSTTSGSSPGFGFGLAALALSLAALALRRR
ncbi:vitamin B12 ABC transporter, B12-binding component BtuF [Halarchaeum acidiphilum MH1-52-1]|uniref:Vitamin B12 ABC transporter, B12-binding component BtuF n=1 Tax=Halarchaeum acidiphilum MH1-52-1 TaxID=1261545 RepID=U3A1R2_9EURY|nr:vitamin B12 ABC transporter, B12-binding component BtuF [Halarchaeum acidiphilum MH1-52-1]